MRKVVDFNFLTVMILVMILAFVAISEGIQLSKVNEKLDQQGRELNEYIEDGEVDDVEGWGYIYGGVGHLLGGLAVGIGWIVLVFFPAAAALIIFVPAFIARLVYKGRGIRLLIYRITMFLVYVVMSAFALLLGGFIFGEKLGGLEIAMGIISVYTAVVTVLGVRNTYTSRITCEDGDANELEIEKVQ